MLIAESADPWSYVLHSDEWRMWDGMWTLAPGYFWFLAVLFRLGGMHLLGVRVDSLEKNRDDADKFYQEMRKLVAENQKK